MTTKRFLLGIALLLVGMPVCAQVSNDNEDEVYKVERPQTKDFVPGQVLFKLKDGQQAKVRRAGGQATAGISSLDKVLKEFTVQEMEQLLPNAKVTGTPRRAKAYNGQTIVERDLTQLYKVTLPEEKMMQTLELVEELKQLDEVEFAEPNYKVYLTETTNLSNCTNVNDLSAGDHIADSYDNNPMASQQWYLKNYGVDQLWTKPIINPTRPVIAIIDTGVDLTHPDLKDNLWTNTAEAEGEANYDNDGNGFKGDVHGWDFINNTPNVKDFNMHGTHVAGIAAACNNDIGIIGANPQALIMAVSVMQSDGTGDIATVIKGVNYAVANGATVLNLSLGTYAYSSALRLALANAYQKCVIVAAAGNDHYPIDPPGGRPMWPAAFSFVLGVQASMSNGILAAFSNYDDSGPTFCPEMGRSAENPDGRNYELKAPGVSMLSTIPGGKYKVLNGTSMAAPLVAGAVSTLTMVKDYLRDDQSVHQEILWGDLIHSNNIAEAFSLTNRPAELDLIKMQIQNRKDLSEETDDDYSGDNEIDAGEIVSIYPVIRTTFGEANNIKMHLEMGDEFEDATTVEIYSDAEHKVDFGWHLDAYGRNVSVNPLVMKVGSHVADNRHIKMKLIIECDESTGPVEKPFTIIVTNMIKIKGLITENQTLTADHTYLVNDDLGINNGVTLTIEPGTRIEINEGKKIKAFGDLVAEGTPEKPIVFAPHAGASSWYLLKSSESSSGTRHYYTYTNSDNTLFTMMPTDETPIEVYNMSKKVYYGNNETNPSKTFYLSNYVLWYDNMADMQEKLTDPDFLTPSVLNMLSEWEDYCSQYSDTESSEKPNSAWIKAELVGGCRSWLIENPSTRFSYCKIEGNKWIHENDGASIPYLKDCVIKSGYFFSGIRINDMTDVHHDSHYAPYSNLYGLPGSGTPYSDYYYVNLIFDRDYNWLGVDTYTPTIDKSIAPSYLGTGSVDIVRQRTVEGSWSFQDLSNLRTIPFSEAHGTVWKVLVNGYNALDEYEQLPPLGVGTHKFEVYFNRPMNKAVTPNVSFGVRTPYSQNAVNENGSWNDEGTIYTVYKTITGKTKSDGINRIYVYGAEDNEYFEILPERHRFQINIQAAGSMASGFMAEAGLGKVNLTWDNENNSFEDAMGFNIYRYKYVEKTLPAGWYDGTYYDEERTITVPDTVRINADIVDIETTEFTDYDVTPGETYYYLYKVLSTDLQEFDVSNVVAATPLTSELGDANGSGIVDVADVIATVNYAAGLEPKPFIFEAADMNTDLNIDILDVVGIIQKILHPTAAPVMAMNEAQAVYTIEDGVLYVESPVALAGVQAQINSLTPNPSPTGEGSITVSEDLDGFEHVTAWLSDNDMLFLAYNLNGKTLTPGKHALLKIGDADVTQIRLSDPQGHNVEAVPGEGATAVDAMGSKVQTQKGIYDLQGRKLSPFNSHLSTLKKGVYIINGKKVVK